MDNMHEMRNRLGDGKYDLTLEVGGNEYFNIYNDVDIKSGEDLLRNYLRSNEDDGRFENIEIKYNKARNIVKVNAQLDYSNNNHTNYSNRGRLM